MKTALRLKRVATFDCSYDESVPYMGYVGIGKKGLADGFVQSLQLELDYLGLNGKPEYDTTLAFCEKRVRRFITEVWSLWGSLKSESSAERIAQLMKDECKQIVAFVEKAVPFLTNYEESPVCDFCYQPSMADKSSHSDGYTLCNKCPKYLARQFYLCPVDLEMMETVEVNWFQVKVPAYRHLWLATMRLYRFVALNRDMEDEGVKFNTLLMLPVSIGKLYEMTNPVGNLINDGLDAKLHQLESEPQPHTEEEWNYFNAIWDEVRDDIFSERDTNLNRYARTWRIAVRSIPHRQFEEGDYFFSPKSGSYKIKDSNFKSSKKIGRKTFRRKQSAFLTSLAEIDPIKDEPAVIAFDQYVNYKSYYNTKPVVNTQGYWSVYTNVLNKGKRKLRGIRMSCNSVQDRCQYLEHLDAAWSDRLATSCRLNQVSGYLFGINATQTWYEYRQGIRENFCECPSIYNTDFTDATDTISQDILWRFNDMLYGHEIADFWQSVCSRPFKIKYPQDKGVDYKTCTPKVGNPQGVKKSFTDFHNLHQFLALMTLKILSHLKKENPDIFIDSANYSRTPVEYFFRILGDDNGFWSLKDDPDINKDIFPFYDEEMGCDGAMYQVYCWLCKMCNWYLNPSKAQITRPSSESSIWEFAKVTVVDGSTFTAPPFRMIASMASKTAHPMVKPLAFALWRAKTYHYLSEQYIEHVLQTYSDGEEMYDFFHKVIFGGFLGSLEHIKDDSLVISDVDRALIRYSLIKAEVSTGLVSQILSEGECEVASSYRVEELLWDTFDEYMYNSLEFVNEHKFNILIDKHFSLCDLAEELTQTSEIDDKILISFCNMVALRGNYSKAIDNAFAVMLNAHWSIEDIQDGLISESEFVTTMNSITDSDMRDLRRFTGSLITRGTDKRPTVESTIGLKAWEEYSQLVLRLSRDETLACESSQG